MWAKAGVVSKIEYLPEPKGEAMIWSQPNAMNRYHELRMDGALYATLRWNKMYGSLATAECHAGRFTFKRTGFLRPSITVRREDSDNNLATMQFQGSAMINTLASVKGIVEFDSGDVLTFKKTGLRKPRWAFYNRSGTPVVEFHKIRAGKPRVQVILDDDHRRISYVHILLVLGWYAIVLDYEEAEGVVGLIG